MKLLIIKNDLIRNKAINFVLFLFMMCSAILAILSVIVTVQTFTSISELYKKSEPAHFIQMHKGDINQNEIEQFLANYESVVDWQIVTMINVFGNSLHVVQNEHTFDLSNIRLDIGLVKQNETKDLLLNSQHEKVILQEGEIAIPVLLKEMYDMEVGDQIILTVDDVKKEFVIKEFILDSMMNSTMASSTRILLSDADFASLDGQVGENEYLIEVFFADPKEAVNFQTAYENARLPQNGQAVTYTIIFILSALTDISTVFVLLLVSILLIVISFICVKYTLMATLEEERREIGSMKAIGLSFTEIRDIYLSKYRALAMISVTFGYIVALFISNLFTKHISVTFGNNEKSLLTILLPLVVACLIYLLIIFYCKKTLKNVKKLTVVDALVHGKGFENDNRFAKDGLYKSKTLSVNWLLAIREVVYNAKSWFIVPVVTFITILMILIPFNLVHTFKAPEFITYMGSALEDILIEIENGENIETNYTKVKQLLDEDEAIENYDEYRRVRVQTHDADGRLMNLHIDYGTKAGVGLQYLDGEAPDNEFEIAISYLNAEKMGKAVGDIAVLSIEDKERNFIISGIYQDVTSGGFTAKSIHEFSNLNAHKYSLLVKLRDPIDAEKQANDWSNLLGAGIAIHPMEEYIEQTLGGVVTQLSTMVSAVAVIGALLVMLVTTLFLKLRLAKDEQQIAVFKAIGFSERDIKIQYLIKMFLVSLSGILVGLLLVTVLGEKIINIALSIAGLGIKKVDLIMNPMVSFFVCPLVLLLLILLVSSFILGKINRGQIALIINK